MAWWLWLIIGSLGGFFLGLAVGWAATLLYIGKGMWG